VTKYDRREDRDERVRGAVGGPGGRQMGNVKVLHGGEGERKRDDDDADAVVGAGFARGAGTGSAPWPPQG
jgi:hypothetical protein